MIIEGNKTCSSAIYIYPSEVKDMFATFTWRPKLNLSHVSQFRNGNQSSCLWTKQSEKYFNDLPSLLLCPSNWWLIVAVKYEQLCIFVSDFHIEHSYLIEKLWICICMSNQRWDWDILYSADHLFANHSPNQQYSQYFVDFLHPQYSCEPHQQYSRVW